MSYVLVTADLPGVTPNQRDIIYKCLEEKYWIKVKEPHRDISTTWYAPFKDGASESAAIRETIKDFDSCANPYCKPKMVIHWGPNKPTFHGLT